MFNSNGNKGIKCIACGVVLTITTIEVAPLVSMSLCSHCQSHQQHISLHVHQEQPFPIYVGRGLDPAAISTSATARIITRG